MWVEFIFVLEFEVLLWTVISKSPSYTVSLLRQFHCRWETVSPTVLKYLFIDVHIPVIFEA